MNLSPAGTNKEISGRPAVEALGERIPKSRHIIAARAYNYVLNERFALPVWRLGYTTIDDLHNESDSLEDDYAAAGYEAVAALYSAPPNRTAR
ncbi:hypothetical protein B2J88_28350 [Rhodococcus sp. SRB_17]|uniref:hypothetical protein n=1 Tax=Rhodococcus sp. OK302 TaxID=1882769 RepID=UPI000B941DD2|nr:hypothetical protein [Rhodococcus sp. OK302]NMM88219.1 hypothetical protein [Rhodococcus sp. SRB_17]OYD71002.1 hypothetical protein BDB13_4652 [Rhodococcus sp. OK302]